MHKGSATLWGEGASLGGGDHDDGDDGDDDDDGDDGDEGANNDDDYDFGRGTWVER